VLYIHTYIHTYIHNTYIHTHTYLFIQSCDSGGELVSVSCEHGTQSSGFLKCEEFLDSLRDYQLLKMDSIPCSLFILFT